MAEDVKKEDKKKKKKPNKIVSILLISIGILTVLMGPYYLPDDVEIWGISGIKTAFSSLEQTSVNWRFVSKALTSGTVALGQGTTKVRQKEGYYNKIVVAAVDEKSFSQYGEWPFDRQVHADFVNHFQKMDEARRPSMIFFDIIFGEKSLSPKSDLALAQSFKNYEGDLAEDIILTSIGNFNIDLKNRNLSQDPQAVLDYQQKKMMSEGMSYNDIRAQKLKKFELTADKNFKMDIYDTHLFSYNKISTMMPELIDGLDVMGAANIDSTTTTIRKKPLVLKAIFYTNVITKDTNGKTIVTAQLINKYYPDIVLAMTAKLMNSHISNIVLKKGVILINNSRTNLSSGEKLSDPFVFRIPVDNRMRININYKSRVDSQYVRTISYKDMTRSGLPRDSIVMVGVTSLGATDVWLSPLGNMAGIYHLAFALGTVLNQDFIREVPKWLNMLYTALLTFAIALLISRGIRSTMAAGLVGILVPLIVGFILFQFNVEIVTMIPLLSAILTLITGAIFLLLTEEKEKKFIKSTFGSYVNPDLVDQLIQNPDMMKLGGDSKDLTILFSDIRSFTTMSEGMTPQYLIDYLNLYLTEMTDIVMDTKGTLDKYIGDAVMAFWGAPIELEDHAYIACKAAVMMMEVLPKFNQERAVMGDKPINIGIGLNSNVVNVGNVGSEKRKNYTVIGDGVNLASRLEGANKFYKTNIIISEYTYEKVKDRVIARELDLIRVKGKNLPVKIYELLDVL